MAEQTLSGEFRGRAWRATYVHSTRYATTTIEAEYAPGHWVTVSNVAAGNWETEDAMRYAIEQRLEQYFDAE